MTLDNRTLLFSLMMISGLIALSLALVSRGGSRDGMRVWAWAMGLEAVGWLLIAVRGAVPDFLSIVVANLFLVGAQALKLLAVYQFRGLPWPLWRCFWPLLAMLVLLSMLDYGDFRHRLVYGSVIYIAQMLMLLDILRTDVESRKGRAWWLLFGATVAILPIMVLRAVAAFLGAEPFATVPGGAAPNAVQLLLFVCVIALDILGSLGFILMEKERSDLELRALAMTDFLTKMLNRRAFTLRAEQEMAAARRTGAPLSLLLIDIDYFKIINDEYGHTAGDRVLAEVARVIGTCVRRQDTVGRYGGEEFGVLLPATDQAGALVLAEKLRQAVADATYDVGRGTISVTISIGVSTCPAPGFPCYVGIAALVTDADRALYQAKNEGRNRTAVALGAGGASLLSAGAGAE